ncbi:MAG: hypothetical protein ABJN42_19860 [Roseibium sp.]|uniref:hypothetical protein n=1 Tax=Roseibium sp. TaxID=1936156 RepID=UPI003298649E
MPFVMKKIIREVVHIGHLDSKRGERDATLDGPCLSVCQDPELWRRAKGLNGPEWRLRSTQAEFIDAIEMTGEEIDEIAKWMLARDYMKPCVAWGVDHYDADKDDFVSKVVATQEEGARLVGRSLEEEISACERLEGATTELDHYKLEKRAIKMLGGWPDPLDWVQAGIILYTRQVIMMKHPYVVGIWWNEPETERGDVAPSGLIFPEKIDIFTVEDEEGEDVPFLELFPEYDLLNGRSQKEFDRKLVGVD